jgi:hypothetical protein
VIVDQDEFWTLMESAVTAAEGNRDGEEEDDFGEAIAQELVSRLARLDTASVLSFDDYLGRATSVLHRWDVWAAAYLINGGCGDDSFIDFKAGVVTLGREWHQRVVANPDSLADHPAVQEVATGRDTDFLFPEPVNYAAGEAFEQITGDHDAYNDAASQEGYESESSDMGENFDFDDPEQMRRRLPRLAEMFLTLKR